MFRRVKSVGNHYEVVLGRGISRTGNFSGAGAAVCAEIMGQRSRRAIVDSRSVVKWFFIEFLL
jgi:hypothetical protein